MITSGYIVHLRFRKPDDYRYARLTKLWKDQKALAFTLDVQGFEVASNLQHCRDSTLKAETITFWCPTLDGAVTAQHEFVALMKNRGYTYQRERK